MGRKFVDRQPGEQLTFCEGYKPLRDANKLLKHHGLVIRWRGHPDMGDQVFIRIERLKDGEHQKAPADQDVSGGD